MTFSLTPITLVPSKQNKNTLQLSGQLFHKLNVANEEKLTLSLGKQAIDLTIQIAELTDNEMVLSENIFQEFFLPIRRIKFKALYICESHTLQLGPIIGLLTDFHVMEDAEPNFRSIHLFCEELHRGIDETDGFFYVFAFESFPQKGYYLDEGKWVSAKLPLPDVIYNRVHSRRLEHIPIFKQFRKQLELLSIPLFNDRFLSKWDVYEDLIKESHLHSFIPDTRLFSHDHLIDYAQKYDTVYIKPVHGSQGRNIFKIIKLDHNKYTYQTSFQSKTDDQLTSFSIDELYQHLKPILGNRIYIIQQGISLLTDNGSVMDFRVLCHKSGMDEWKVTSLVARISAENEIVSNLAKGGKILRPHQALGSCMNQKEAVRIISLMKELAIATAAAISRYSSGITGELGIDIGIDQSGKPWLIEVNSKPSKSFEDCQEKIRPSAKAIIHFCTLLTFDSGFEKEET